MMCAFVTGKTGVLEAGRIWRNNSAKFTICCGKMQLSQIR
jgi:hypothetical protein